MLVKNYYNLKNLVLNNFSYIDSAWIYTQLGEGMNAVIESGYESSFYSWQTSHMNIVVGTSDTTPNIEDYGLGAKVTDVTVTPLVTINVVDNRFVMNISATVTYTGAEESIEIKEIGVTKYLRYGKYAYGDFLIARELLETPVTVKQNESFTVSLTLEI